MRRLTIGPTFGDGALVDAARALRAGDVVAFPTDTLYGLAADPRSEAALARLFALKGRGAGKVVALIAGDLLQVRAVATVSDAAARLAARFWPGPLTLVLPANAGLAPAVVSDTGAVGVRVPDHGVARALAAGFGHAITATSANRSGEPPTADPDEVARQLPGVDLLIDTGRSPGGPPSTVVDLSRGAPVLLRAGAVPWERVLESL